MTQSIDRPTNELNLEAELAQFTCTNEYHKHWLGLIYTDGVKFLHQKAQAYWLLDSIALYQQKVLADPMLQEFQIWRLKLTKDKAAVLTCERDTNDIFLTENIPYTDFPLPEIKLYLENGVLCLPSER